MFLRSSSVVFFQQCLHLVQLGYRYAVPCGTSGVTCVGTKVAQANVITVSVTSHSNLLRCFPSSIPHCRIPHCRIAACATQSHSQCFSVISSSDTLNLQWGHVPSRSGLIRFMYSLNLTWWPDCSLARFWLNLFIGSPVAASHRLLGFLFPLIHTWTLCKHCWKKSEGVARPNLRLSSALAYEFVAWRDRVTRHPLNSDSCLENIIDTAALLSHPISVYMICCLWRWELVCRCWCLIEYSNVCVVLTLNAR